MAGKTPTGFLLLPPDLVRESLVVQFPHISINIDEHMGVADTRVEIATPRHPDTSTRQQWRSGWRGETMYAHNDGVERHQR